MGGRPSPATAASIVFEERERGRRTQRADLRPQGRRLGAVHLGEGAALGISPDDRWVLSQSDEAGGQDRFLLLPTGQGLARPSSIEASGPCRGERSRPTEAASSFSRERAGAAPALYAQGLAGGEPRAVSRDGLEGDPIVVSSDGRFAAAVGAEGRIVICRLEDATTRPLPGASADEMPIVWSPDGRSLYVFKRNELPARVFRVDVETGRRELWREIAPADRTGLDHIDAIRMTPDARAYAYGYTRTLGSLQIAEGLR